MRTIARSCTAVAIFLALMMVGCASSAPTTQAPAPSVAAKPAADAKASPTSLAAENGSRYQRIVKDGETFYCAQEEFVGSRMQKKVCLTETEYEAMREANRRFMHGLQTAPVQAYDPTKQNQ